MASFVFILQQPMMEYNTIGSRGYQPDSATTVSSVSYYTIIIGPHSNPVYISVG